MILILILIKMLLPFAHFFFKFSYLWIVNFFLLIWFDAISWKMFISVKINIQTNSQLERLSAVKFLSSLGKSKLYQLLASNKSPKSGCRRCWLRETLQTFICIFSKNGRTPRLFNFHFFSFLFLTNLLFVFEQLQTFPYLYKTI